jgi:hypothetical protein
MRIPTALLLMALTGLSWTTQDTPLIDLTIPPNVTAGFAGGFSKSVGSPLTVRILGFPDQDYTAGDDFVYEVEVTNHSPEIVVIPWSNDPTGIADAIGPDAFSSTISLLVDTELDKEHYIAGSMMWGDLSQPQTLLAVGPNDRFRIRGLGRWSIPGVAIAEYLPKSKGRLRVRAVYRIQSNGVLASTAPSPPKPFTLLTRKPL